MSPTAMLGKFKNTHAYRTLKEYSECATVHGISYIFEKVEQLLNITFIYSLCVQVLHPVDRLLWTLVVVLALVGSVWLSSEAYVSYEDSRVVTTLLRSHKIKYFHYFR